MKATRTNIGMDVGSRCIVLCDGRDVKLSNVEESADALARVEPSEELSGWFDSLHAFIKIGPGKVEMTHSVDKCVYVLFTKKRESYDEDGLRKIHSDISNYIPEITTLVSVADLRKFIPDAMAPFECFTSVPIYTHKYCIPGGSLEVLRQTIVVSFIRKWIWKVEASYSSDTLVSDAIIEGFQALMDKRNAVVIDEHPVHLRYE